MEKALATEGSVGLDALHPPSSGLPGSSGEVMEATQLAPRVECSSGDDKPKGSG